MKANHHSMRATLLAYFLLTCLALPSATLADEGMWTFDNSPAQR